MKCESDMQILAKYLALPDTGTFTHDEYQELKQKKHLLLEKLFTSQDDNILRIAMKIKLDNGHIANSRQLISEYLLYGSK